MGRDIDRLDGWKAIGAHFGRDRTTVIRWHNDRSLPVHAIPGGKTRTVYASKAELNAWAAALEADPDPAEDRDNEPAAERRETPTPEVATASPLPKSRRRGLARLIWPIGGVAMLAAAGTVIVTAHRGYGSWPAPRLDAPVDATTSRLYIQASDDLAKRNGPAIARAVREFDDVIKRDPTYAAAFSGLASAFLLEREFGSIDDSIAFPKAQSAAFRARELDPDLASAYRVIGFVDYWWDHDRAAAAAAFQKALRLDDHDPVAHLWYANALADNGEAVPAEREFEAAKLADPGSPAIDTDQAWASWSAGSDETAEREWAAVLAEQPNFVAAHDCLSIAALARGDLRGYAREIASRAKLRGEPNLSSYSSELSDAIGRRDLPAVEAIMSDRARALQAGSERSDLALDAFFTSALGDRDSLLRILSLADARNEKWGSAGYRRRISGRWQNDAVVTHLLARRAPPSMESRSN